MLDDMHRMAAMVAGEKVSGALDNAKDDVEFEGSED